MLGDDSTHSMNMIPLLFHQRVSQWKTHIDKIRDETEWTPLQRWDKCLEMSNLFLEFSPEFLFLLRTYPPADGCFHKDVVDVIMGVHGMSSCFFTFARFFCSDSNGAGHAASLRASHASDTPPSCVSVGIKGSYNPFRTGAHYSFQKHGLVVRLFLHRYAHARANIGNHMVTYIHTH